tara:strand:+ start:34 stop:570 length:537 start_codon:yes stop_codon:yes gene_type:complete
MAGVPTGTSTLSLRNIARERLYGNYGGSGTITGAVSMYDLLNGGNTGGSGDSYPALNVACGNVTPNGSMNSWRGYYQDWVCYYPTSGNYSGKITARPLDNCVSGTTLSDNYWASEDKGSATGSGWTLNVTILYSTNSQPPSSPSVLASVDLIINSPGAGTNTWVTTNSSGVITYMETC